VRSSNTRVGTASGLNDEARPRDQHHFTRLFLDLQNQNFAAGGRRRFGVHAALFRPGGLTLAYHRPGVEERTMTFRLTVLGLAPNAPEPFGALTHDFRLLP
jgi:hypothetical protein